MSKIIFLDIDGVLNSNETAFYFRLHNINQNGYGEFFSADEVPTNANVCWGQDLVDNLRRIVDATKAEIVISSTWRITHPVNQFPEMFKLYGWDNAPVIGRTKQFGDCRGDEIKEWLIRNPEVTNYVILDDNSDMLKEQSGHFVKTSEKYGLSVKNANKAIDILNGPDAAPLLGSGPARDVP